MPFHPTPSILDYVALELRQSPVAWTAIVALNRDGDVQPLRILGAARAAIDPLIILKAAFEEDASQFWILQFDTAGNLSSMADDPPQHQRLIQLCPLVGVRFLGKWMITSHSSELTTPPHY